jgi:hypothetical protein
VLTRFAYLAVTHAFTALRLMPMTNREKDVEILALRHQLTVLQRQLGHQRPQLRPEDRALLAVTCHAEGFCLTFRDSGVLLR